MYANLAAEDMILLAAEFIGRGHAVPREIADALGHDIMQDICTPEIVNDRDQGAALSPNQ